MTEIENDEVAVEALGWVRDMYAWSFAVARLKLVQDMPQPPNNPLMVQPPADKCAPPHMHSWICAQCRTVRRSLGLASILHYTWGPVVHNKSGAVVWEVRAAALPSHGHCLKHARRGTQFDKRSYCGGQYAPGPRRLVRIPEPPVWEEGLHLQVRRLRRACSVA